MSAVLYSLPPTVIFVSAGIRCAFGMAATELCMTPSPVVLSQTSRIFTNS